MDHPRVVVYWKHSVLTLIFFEKKDILDTLAIVCEKKMISYCIMV